MLGLKQLGGLRDSSFVRLNCDKILKVSHQKVLSVLCTVIHWGLVSNYQLSHLRSGQDLVGGK